MTTTRFNHLRVGAPHVVKSLLAIAVAWFPAYAFHEPFLGWLMRSFKPEISPIQTVMGEPIWNGFFIRASIALVGALILAAPIWNYHLVAVLTHDLTPHPRRPRAIAIALLVGSYWAGNALGFSILGSNAFLFIITRLPDRLPAQDLVILGARWLAACGIALELLVLIPVLRKLRLCMGRTRFVANDTAKLTHS